MNELSTINLHTDYLDNHLISLSFSFFFFFQEKRAKFSNSSFLNVNILRHLRESYWAFDNADPHLSLFDRQQLNEYLRKESTDKLTAKFL